MSESLKKNLRSPVVMFAVAGLALAAVGAKFFWPESTALKEPTASKTKVAAKAPGATPSKGAAAKNASAASAAKSAKLQPTEKHEPAPAPAEEPAHSEVETPAPVAAPVRPISAPPRRGAHVAPADVDMSSDTEGLFVISSLRDSDAAGLGDAGFTAAAKGRQTAAPRVGEMSDALSESVVHNGNPAQVPSPTQIAPGDGLGPVFVDETNGFYMRFPAGWSIRKFESEPWVAECGDGQSALMSIGFSAFPSEFTADNIPLDWVARRIKKRADTQLVAQGYAKIMGRKAIWSKSTGPMQMRGQGTVNVMRTTYIIPLGDGRVAEIRIAASPEQFEKASPLMKDSVSTFRLVQRKGAASTTTQQPQAGGDQLMVKTE